MTGYFGLNYYLSSIYQPVRQTTQATETYPKPTSGLTEDLSADAIFNEMNDARVEHGAERLSLSSGLSTSANMKCQDMVTYDYYEHLNSKTGMQGIEYIPMNEPNTNRYSEILNKGTVRTNKDFVDSWLDSASHKTAMLEPTYTSAGVAICQMKDDNSEPLIVAHLASYNEPVTQTQSRQRTTCHTRPGFSLTGNSNSYTTTCN